MRISRRRFAQLAATVAAATPSLDGRPAAVTAGEIVERIKKGMGAPWQDEPIDTFKAGDPSAPISGVAVTAMATLDVLKRSVQQKANLIVTLEPVFYGRLDAQPDPNGRGGRGAAGVPPDDAVLKGKRDFIQKNGLVIWRFANHWRARKPDPMATGLARSLAWSKYQLGGDPARYDLPATTLGALADDIAKRLDAHAGIRAIGDPATRVRRITLLPGVTALAATLQALPECDVVVAGETREWESVEYAQDTVAAGQKKGYISVGKVVSEEPGMNLCADWLKSLVPEVPVRWAAAGDPYWRPA